MKKFISANWGYLLVVVALALLLWPLLHAGFFVTDDGDWMVIRLSAFFQSLRQGQIPVRFLGRLNDGYGYPVANFLYPGFMYLGSVIHVLGFSFVDTIKVILGGSVIGTTALVFLWLRKKFSLIASLVGSLAFVFAPYVAFDMFQRGSVGEVLAWFPAVLGLYSLNSRNKWLFSLAVGSLVVSHNTLAMLFVALYACYIICMGVYEFLIPLILGIGLSGFFWLPALFERGFVVFDSTVISNPAHYFVTAINIGLIGIVNFLFALIFILKPKKKWQRTDVFFFVAFVGSTIMATMSALPVWSWTTLVKLIQFPYRFLAISAAVAPWIIASVLENTSKGVRFALIGFSIVIWLIFLEPLISNIRYTDRPEGYYTTNQATTTVADEYMPKWVLVKPSHRAATPIEFVSGGGKIQMVSEGQRIRAQITATEDSKIQLNTIYYPGWGATIDGLPTTIDYRNPNGVMQISISGGIHNLLAEFRETPARLAADFVSLASFVLWLIMYVRWKGKKV